jgi:glycosyltransferase involved in cell wall biosynthesis
MRKGSIVYVNFAPYDNAGNILDYLLDNFNHVIHFSFSFHKLNKKHYSNTLTVYKNDRITKKNLLFHLPAPEFLLFISLPSIALIIFFQTIWYLIKLYRAYGKLNYYFSVNAFTAWTGIILKNMGVVDKTIFWVWDYYPPNYHDIRIRIARWAYWKFDKKATINSDKTVYLNNRLRQLRIALGILPEKSKKYIVPIGTNPVKRIKPAKQNIIGFLGMMKKIQGLDFLYDNLICLNEKYPDLRIEIIGSGPDEKYFKEKSKRFGKMIKFYGFIRKRSVS